MTLDSIIVYIGLFIFFLLVFFIWFKKTGKLDQKKEIKIDKRFITAVVAVIFVIILNLANLLLEKTSVEPYETIFSIIIESVILVGLVFYLLRSRGKKKRGK